MKNEVLELMSHDIEREFDLVAYANQSMHSGSCLNFEVAAIDTELTLRAKFVTAADARPDPPWA